MTSTNKTSTPCETPVRNPKSNGRTDAFTINTGVVQQEFDGVDGVSVCLTMGRPYPSGATHGVTHTNIHDQRRTISACRAEARTSRFGVAPARPFAFVRLVDSFGDLGDTEADIFKIPIPMHHTVVIRIRSLL